MEYQKNIIFILVFCFSIVEPNPHSGEARYGAHQGSNWPSNQNQPQQHQNYARPQNFYPAVKNANNRNTDSRAYERNYDHRYGTLSNAPGEIRPFYEGPNGRNKLFRQSSTSKTAGGSVFKEKSSLEAVPQSYRPTRPYYEYDDRDNGVYSPSVERNYQHPTNRPYYNSRIPYQRSVSENFGNKFKDTPPQKSRYFDKQATSQNMSPSPLDHKYSLQNRPLSSIPETLRRSPNAAHNSMPELPISSHPRREVNEMMSDPIIQNYLASNRKRYLVLHTNGTVEHVDSLESIVQSYPNFVMFKAGDIITNPHNSTLELSPSVPIEETFHPKMPESGQQIFPERNNFPTYGHNPRAPYVTERAYIQHIDRPVNIPDEDYYVSDNGALAITSTTTSLDSSFVEETTTEYYTTPFPETTTEYSTLSSLLDYELPEYRVINKNVIETTTEYLTYTDSPSEFATTTISNMDDVVQTFTEQPMENATEDSVTEAQFLTTTENYSTLTPKINSADEYLDTVPSTENTNNALHEEKKIDILSKLFNYPSAFGKFIQQNFESLFSADKLNNATKNKIGRRIREVTSASDPYDVMDILEAITQLALTEQTTTEPADVIFNTEDSNTVYPYTEDSIYTTSSPVDAASTTNDFHTLHPETSSSLGVNEEGENPDALNPFIDMSETLVDSEKVEYVYDVVASDEYNDPSSLYTTINYETNPFTTFDVVTSNPFEYLSTEDKSLTSTESDSYSTSNPVTDNIYEDVTNPFIESTTQENRKLRKRHKKKKKSQPVTETYSVDATNPFITSTTEISTIIKEDTPYDVSNKLIASDNDGDSNPPTETNPFILGFQSLNDSDLNPFTEKYSDDNITQSPIETESDETSSYYDGTVTSYEIDVVPFAYSSIDTSSYDELTTTPEPGDNNHTESSDNEDVVPTTIITTEEDVADSTSTEEPAVWFKTDANFWEKLADGTIPYDVVYLFQVHDQPLVEKDTKTTIFPNGTVVQEYIETVWEREGDSKPIVVQSSKTAYPEEET